MKNFRMIIVMAGILSVGGLLFASCRTTVKEEVDENGTVLSRVEYKGGKKNGTATYYYPNGNLRSVIHYKNDLEEGVSEFYNSDGTIISDVEMKAGKKEGRQRAYSPTGYREMECFFKNDLLDGVQSFYDNMGYKTAEITYANGLANGPYRTWHSKNTLQCEGGYKNGMMEGKWIYYDENEMVVGTGQFQNGTGVKKTYKNGELYKETLYEKNHKEGDEKEYDYEGNVVRTVTFHEDRIVAIDGVPQDRESDELSFE